MSIDSHPHGSEKYYCESCEISKNKIEVNSNWKCPDCGNNILIHIKTDKLDNACFRIPISDLRVGDFVLRSREDKFREILGLNPSFKNPNNTQINLKEWGGVFAPKKNNILKLYGGWHN